MGPGLYRWADDHGTHGMPSVARLRRAGYKVVSQHPRYPASWLMWKKPRPK